MSASFLFELSSIDVTPTSNLQLIDSKSIDNKIKW